MLARLHMHTDIAGVRGRAREGERQADKGYETTERTNKYAILSIRIGQRLTIVFTWKPR